MNKFINLRKGKISITIYRPCECRATTLDDLITCAIEGSDDYLTADADELYKHPHPQAYDFLDEFADEDFLDELADEDFLDEFADEVGYE